MQQPPWMPPQPGEAVRVRGFDEHQGKISPSSLSSWGLGTSSCRRALCCALLSSGARRGHFWHQQSRLLINSLVCSCSWTTLQVKL